MTWAGVPSWVSIVLMISAVAATSGVVAAIHLAMRRPGAPRGGFTPEARSAAVVLGGWLLLSVILSGAGVFQARAGSFPWILLAVAVPMAAGAAFLVLSPAARRLSAAIPAHWAIAAQTPRVIGVVFLLLMAQRRLPGVFANRAGWGDILIGAAAPFVAVAYRAGKPWSRGVSIGFNVAGLADLALAVGTGVMAAPGPLRQIFTNPSTELMTLLPMVMIPVFLVPLFTLIHVFSIRQLLQEARRRTPVLDDAGRGRAAGLASLRSGR